MATSYTSLLGFALPVTGELQGTWGDTVNNSITQLAEDSIAGVATASVASGDWTLSTTGSGATNEARKAILIPTGSPGVSRNIICPSKSKAYVVVNQSNAAVVVKGAATSGVTVAAGDKVLVAWNGTDFVQVGVASSSLAAYAPLASPALTGNPTAPTAAQFDNGTSVATTAFVQRALGSFAGASAYAASATLTTSDMGKMVMLNFASPGGTISLPSLASVSVGTAVVLFNWGATNSISISAQTGQVINNNTANPQTFTLPVNSTVILIAESGATWDIVGGSAQLTTSPIMSGAYFTTAAQFDNTTKLATTAFVKTSGLHYSTMSSPTAGFSVPASACGTTYELAGTSSPTATLPALSACPQGEVLTFRNVGSGTWTVSRTGTDQISLNNATNVNSVTLNPGDSLVLVSDGSTLWRAVGGSAQLQYAAVFSSSLSASGYQKLPSGLIIQWGTGSVAATGSYITLPIAFPNAFLKVLCGVSPIAPVGVTANNNVGFQASPDGLTRFAGRYYQDSVGYPNSNFHFIAIGY